jgi:hypothetical protein
MRANLEAIEKREKVCSIAIGSLTESQLSAINEGRIEADLPPIIAKVLFVGAHVYRSRVIKDGYEIEDILDEAESALSADSEVIYTPYWRFDMSRLLNELLQTPFLDRSQLKSIEMDPVTLSLRLVFVQVEGKGDLKLELDGIAQVNISKDFNDEEMLAIVGEATLRQYEDGTPVLKLFRYPFTKGAPDYEPMASEKAIFHFHLEGDVCIDVICKNVRFTPESEKLLVFNN